VYTVVFSYLDVVKEVNCLTVEQEGGGTKGVVSARRAVSVLLS